MKQLTVFDGFVLSLGHGQKKRRLQQALRPQGALISLDLDLGDVMADLDPGMLDWEAGLFVNVA